MDAAKIFRPHGGHFMKDRHVEIFIGVLLFITGCIMLWDAFDNRNKKLPWPGGAIMPW
jgi:uncharacterized membrane protein HdeD (DUF308 family)